MIMGMTSATSRSGRPAIYGIVAAAEVERLRPLSQNTAAAQSEVQALELTAAEMAQAAADLVAREREILSLKNKGADNGILAAKETARQEAAAALERKMSAMEALLVSRRALAVQPEADQAPAMSTLLEPPRVAATGSGPGAGDGYEILLQVSTHAAHSALDGFCCVAQHTLLERTGLLVPGYLTLWVRDYSHVLVQGFNWESWKHNYYKSMMGKVKELADIGFTAIWLPPPSDSVSEQVSRP